MMRDASEQQVLRIPWKGARVAGVLLTLVVAARGAVALQQPQVARPVALVNGDMETVDAEFNLAGWRVPTSLVEAGYEMGPEDVDVFAGKCAARIDSREATLGANTFGNLSQSLDATPWQGKRVRFRAAVKVAEGEPDGRAQMWLRVDRSPAGGTPRTGFFDNMQDRPIRSSEWQTYEIVGDVAKDAQVIVLGVITFGKCVVLVDEATFEVAEASVKPTGGGLDDAAPQQPFFTAWLFLPLGALALFACAYLAPGRAGKFAFEFTLVYWVMYALPTMLGSVVPFGYLPSSALQTGPIDTLVRWGARSLLGIEGELVSAIGNGSGDTTYSYVQALLTFVLALGVAVIWSLVDRRATDHARLKDLLRSWLRYYLAVTMAGYGLAKLASLMNQFPEPGLWRLTKTYGESSPMGILWTFMGSSRAYTHFAGALELLGALLLVWRRTALLGALVSAGVMLNIMLMNFCYDVPVKLFSAHLATAAGIIALPDAGRLAQLFLGLGRSAAPLAYPFTGRAAKWIHRVLKAGLVVMVVGLPLVGFWFRERSTAGIRPALGEWKLATLELDGQGVAPAAGEVAYLTLPPWPKEAEDGWKLECSATLVGGVSAGTSAWLTTERIAFDVVTSGSSRLLAGAYDWSIVDDELHLESKQVRATLVPAAHDHLLMRHGFRWINERPYNR